MKKPNIHPDARALVFDLDGTLADTMKYHVIAWIRTGIHYNKPITEEMINQLNGTPTLQVVVELNRMYGWHLDPKEVKAYKDNEYQKILKAIGRIQAIPEIYEVAKEARDKYPMCIGTGSTRPNAIRALRDMGVEDWFEAVITADDIEHPKPHPDTFLRCAEIMGVEPSDCQVFEDGPMGLLAAERAGMIVTNVLES